MPKPTHNPQIVLTDDGPIPIGDHTVVLAREGAPGRFTLDAPTLAQNGTRLEIALGTAFPHSIEATVAGLMVDAYQGKAGSVYVANPNIGLNAAFRAYNGRWIGSSAYGGGSLSGA